VEYIHRLEAVALPVERASARALLECSEEGLVILSRLNIESSRNAYLQFLLDSVGGLLVESEFGGDTVYVASDSVLVTREVVRTETEYRERELTRWEKIKQEVGGIGIGLGAFLVVYVLIRLWRYVRKKAL
jgi:hypothetical protein